MRLARVLHGRGGLHTPPSLRLVTGMALGASAATLVSVIHAFRQAALLPYPAAGDRGQ